MLKKEILKTELDFEAEVEKLSSGIQIVTENPFFEDLEIIEVQLGNKLIEEDIIRFQDIYGRENK